ncbi:MAG: SxtJ family membrane protein [Bacteroidota bacterium]
MSEHDTTKKTFFSSSISREQSKDTGLALMLILLLAGFFTENQLFYRLAIPVLLLVMMVPGWFYPLAVIWFGFSHLTGTFMSWILLTLVFFIVVLPVAAFRKLSGIDNLKLKQFRKGSATVMHIRNHVFLSTDIDKPY